MSALFHGYQSLVENSPDTISLINKDGKILFGNSSVTKLLGYRPDELLSRNNFELIHPEDRERSSSLFKEVINWPSAPRTWDSRILRKDGTYCWVESTVHNLLHDLEVQAIVMYQRDIHSRVEEHEKSKLQAEELTRANLRMEEFAYTIAHDLREPLRAISLYTELLFSRPNLDDDRKEMAQFVINGARRLSAMVADLLAFARSGMSAPAALLSLETAVEQAIQNLSLEIKESAAMITVGPLPEICSNEIHMVRIFQNLISNAIKYRSERPLSIFISSEQRDHDCVIKVRDNGVGIATEYQKKIFLPFIRLSNRDIPGTGLGLAVCEKTIEGLGGVIWVESAEGVGSTFSFSLPARAVAPPALLARHAG